MRNPSIDILPMAAVGLILVLVMMVVAPLTMSRDQTPVNVPVTQTAERKVEENTTVTFTVDSQILLNDRPVADLADLEVRLGAEITADPYRLVVVRADREVFHDQVLDLLAAARRAGAVRIACATKRSREVDPS